MQEEESFDLPQFPNLLGAVMQMGQDSPEREYNLDANGLVELPMLPLRGTVIYPNMVTPLFVGRDKSLAALQAAVANGETMLAVAQKMTTKPIQRPKICTRMERRSVSAVRCACLTTARACCVRAMGEWKWSSTFSTSHTFA